MCLVVVLDVYVGRDQALVKEVSAKIVVLRRAAIKEEPLLFLIHFFHQFELLGFLPFLLKHDETAVIFFMLPVRYHFDSMSEDLDLIVITLVTESVYIIFKHWSLDLSRGLVPTSKELVCINSLI